MSSTGRLNASDLPLAVPVVTIVWPRRALSSASAWWDQSASIPAPESASRSAGWRSPGRGVVTTLLSPFAGGRDHLALARRFEDGVPGVWRVDTAHGLP